MKFKGFAAALTAATVMLGGIATAESHVDPAIAGAIKARQATMQLYAFSLGTLGGMAKGAIDYDADAASAAANNLAALTKLNQMAMWPQGSDSESVDGSRALPAIWTDFAGVSEKAKAAADAADAMAMAAGNGLDALRGAIGGVGASCGGCHKAYRAPE